MCMESAPAQMTAWARRPSSLITFRHFASPMIRVSGACKSVGCVFGTKTVRVCFADTLYAIDYDGLSLWPAAAARQPTPSLSCTAGALRTVTLASGSSYATVTTVRGGLCLLCQAHVQWICLWMAPADRGQLDSWLHSWRWLSHTVSMSQGWADSGEDYRCPNMSVLTTSVWHQIENATT